MLFGGTGWDIVLLTFNQGVAGLRPVRQIRVSEMQRYSHLIGKGLFMADQNVSYKEDRGDKNNCLNEAGGDDMILMLDGGPYQQRELALRLGKLCDELNFYWYEEPVFDYDIEGLIKPQRKT